jgi:hypothetical protein
MLFALIVGGCGGGGGGGNKDNGSIPEPEPAPDEPSIEQPEEPSLIGTYPLDNIVEKITITPLYFEDRPYYAGDPISFELKLKKAASRGTLVINTPYSNEDESISIELTNEYTQGTSTYTPTKEGAYIVTLFIYDDTDDSVYADTMTFKVVLKADEIVTTMEGKWSILSLSYNTNKYQNVTDFELRPKYINISLFKLRTNIYDISAGGDLLIRLPDHSSGGTGFTLGYYMSGDFSYDGYLLKKSGTIEDRYMTIQYETTYEILDKNALKCHIETNRNGSESLDIFLRLNHE